jgi:methyl-accepting chemotaxis protein
MKIFSFFSRLKIAQKLPLYIVGAGFAVGVSIGVSTYLNAAKSLEEARRDQLATALEGRKSALQTYFASVEQDLQILATAVTTRWALMGFAEGWSELEEEAEAPPPGILRQLYVSDNPHNNEDLADLDAADDDSTYSEVHALYHPWYRGYLRNRDYADIFLLDEAGNVLYSVSKKADFASNLIDGEWRDTALGDVFRAALENPEEGNRTFSDFVTYPARQDMPASFIATPVLDEDGEFLGILALELSVDRINEILQQAAGLGDSGETYLVGSDFLMRSDSRFAESSTILTRRLELDAVKRALAGDHDTMLDIDREGRSIMTAFSQLDFNSVRWALIGQMDEKEIKQPVTDLGLQTMIISALIMALLFVVGWFLTRDIVQPLREILKAIGEFAKGNQAAVPGERRADEIGELARSASSVYQKGLEAARLRSALDGCSNMVMVTNARFQIVYTNNALGCFLREHLTLIQKLQPEFAIEPMIGSDVRKLLPMLSESLATGMSKAAPKTLEIRFENRRVQLVASPVLNEAGKSLGMVIEWSDATLELTMQESFDRVIEAARNGDFDQQIDLAGVDGIYHRLGDGMNQLTSTVAQATDEIGAMFEAMASGDLGRRVQADLKGKLGTLKDNANRTADELTRIVGEIQKSATRVKSAAADITSGTEDLSDRTEQAKSSLEETASSSREMSDTVKQNAENARNASQLADDANHNAKSGGEVVEQAVIAMAKIEDSAQKITDIIGVIDEIAFQTNLLALNASVEAARAGEAGKGFAVVAQEVRQLAQRSAQAADDIKTLIQNSNGQVNDGVKLVNQAGQSLTAIMGSIGKVSDIVQKISNASQEQAAGVQEINSSITNMDEMTKQNSALVEESSASARTLSDQALKLGELLAFFKAEGDQMSGRQESRLSKFH